MRDFEIFFENNGGKSDVPKSTNAYLQYKKVNIYEIFINLKSK